MRNDNALKIINAALPLAGMGLMVFYKACETSCSSLQGKFAGMDLKIIGVLFMVSLLSLTLPAVSHRPVTAQRIRVTALAGALGGETLLVRFQIVNDVYCPYCLAFGSFILVLFMANIANKHRYPALGAYLAGLAAFYLLFEGSIVPLYN